MKKFLLMTCLLTTAALSASGFGGAAVLPLKIGDDVEIMLSREAAGRDVGTWDAFGGARDADEREPFETAGREFCEEANIGAILGWSVDETRRYIRADEPHTIEVVGDADSFQIFLTEFAAKDFDAILQNFGNARARARAWIYREKDGLAVVKLRDLETALQNSRSNHSVTVTAKIHYLASGKIPTTTQKITLRPFLAKMLRER